jgi:hypothetical protein
MANVKITPFEQLTALGSGITMSLCETRAGQYIRLSITSAAQERYFGGPVTENDAIALGIDDAAGKNHLMRISLAEPDAADAIPLLKSVKGSVYVKLTPWCQVASGKRPAKAMMVAAQPDANSVLVKLPEWSRPPARKYNQGKSIMEVC